VKKLLRTVVVTGIPGVGKSTVLGELQNLAKEKEANLVTVNYGTVMNELFQNLGKSIHRDKMRRQGLESQRKIQEQAAEIIAGKARDGILVVDTHSFVRTSSGFWPGLPYNVLAKLKPSLFVLVEASTDEIAMRRQKDKTRMRDEGSLEEVKFDLTWSRATVSSCAVLAAAPAIIIKNETGKQRQAAERLWNAISNL